MKLTPGEYCRFSLSGRIALLHQYGKFICSRLVHSKKILVYKLYDFYVEVIKDLVKNTVLEANPVWSRDMLEFLISL